MKRVDVEDEIRPRDTSRASGWLMAQLRRATPQTAAGRLRRKALGLIRKAVVRAGDPLIRVKINHTTLVLPLSHQLPVYATDDPLYSQNVGRIAKAVAEGSPDAAAFLDIGANVGDTAAIVTSYCTIPILCIEGHPAFVELLRRNAAAIGDHVSIEASFVGTTTGDVQGTWSYNDGTARVVEDAAGSSIRTRKLSDILQDHPGFEAARIMKIDTDGFDCAILEAELEFLARQHPVIFFEFDPRFYSADHYGISGLAKNLHTIGYARAMVYDNLGYYIASVDLSAGDQLEDIDCYARALSRRSGYLDICMFHADDLELAATIRASELAFVRSQFGDGDGVGRGVGTASGGSTTTESA